MLALVSACSPVRMPTQNSYTIDSINADTVHARYTNKTVLVTTPIAAPAFATSKMAYVKKSFQVQYFAENRWVAQPAHLLTPLMVASLQQTNHFKNVVGSPFTGHTDYRIDSQIITLQQNFIDNPSEVELSVRVNIVNNTTQQLIASKTINTIATAPQNDPYSGVIATNRAVADMLGQMSAFVVKNI